MKGKLTKTQLEALKVYANGYCPKLYHLHRLFKRGYVHNVTKPCEWLGINGWEMHSELTSKGRKALGMDA